jgi:hypothetical protein
MRKKAGIYCRDNVWYVSSYSRARGSGVWQSFEAPICLPSSASHSQKGETALIAVRASTHEAPAPPPGFDPAALLLKAAGLPSFTKFAKGTKSIDVSLEDGKLTVTPQKNGGPRRGFEWLTEKKIELDAEASHEQIGEALDEAFRRCE